MNIKYTIPLLVMVAATAFADVEIEPNNDSTVANDLKVIATGQTQINHDIDFFKITNKLSQEVPILFSCSQAAKTDSEVGWFLTAWDEQGNMQADYLVLPAFCKDDPYKIVLANSNISYLSVESSLETNIPSFNSSSATPNPNGNTLTPDRPLADTLAPFRANTSTYSLFIGGSYTGALYKGKVVDSLYYGRDTVSLNLTDCGDSSATFTITGNKLNLINMVAADVPIKVQIGGFECKVKDTFVATAKGSAITYTKTPVRPTTTTATTNTTTTTTTTTQKNLLGTGQ